uniref:Glutathione transferase n=1 Tax=Cucumis sativus TaxID=3659 RepID=A0A0A0LQD4_CUCSA
MTSPVAASSLKLYSYWRSSCSHRVRIALNLKQYEKLNPIGYVPTLVDGDVVIADSFAIIMYLEEKYPQNPLLPCDLGKRAINYQAANIVSSSIQPLQNIAVLKYIEEKSGPAEKLRWVQHNIEKGFTALEKLLKPHAGKYATGDEIYMADLFLAPQIHGAINRFNIDMSKFSLLNRLNEEYNGTAAFQDAAPAEQPDATPTST